MKFRRRNIRHRLLELPTHLPMAMPPMGLMTESFAAEPDPPRPPFFYAQTSTPESVAQEIARERQQK